MYNEHYRTAAALIAGLILLLACCNPALAGKDLSEYETAPFSLAAHPWLEVEALPTTHQAGFELARVLPPGITGMTVIGTKWPGGDNQLYLAVGNTGALPGREDVEPHYYMAVLTGESDAIQLPVGQNGSSGITRLCIWPTEKGAEAELVVLYSVASNMQDASVYGFAVAADGQVRALDTGNALTLYGWFDVADVNDDGAYELITSRNLDGMWGGFFYHAVRSYDAVNGAYLAQPDGCSEYFEEELAWLNWVIDTRPLIQSDPEKYLNRTGIGPAYIADYNGVRYGFDSIIEVPLTFTAVGDVKRFNNERRDCFRLIAKYRDELSAWLAGGSYPATWKLSR